MKNILSFQNNARFTGQDILDWANYQVKNKTSHFIHGKRILIHYWNLKPNEMYFVRTNFSGTGCNEIIHKIYIVKAEK